MLVPVQVLGLVLGFFARACLGRHGHDGLAGPSGQPGTARGYLGRAWAVPVGWHGTACSSGHAGPTDLGPGPVVPGPCRAGRPIWPIIPSNKAVVVASVYPDPVIMVQLEPAAGRPPATTSFAVDDDDLAFGFATPPP
uniref:Secreted protein n=1 Tax=Oryza rufipogon TaxID=4529 RepID=A0A0E0PH30_ORYRU